jgi:hypothetical protein
MGAKAWAARRLDNRYAKVGHLRILDKRIGLLEEARSGPEGDAVRGAADHLAAEFTRLRAEIDRLAGRIEAQRVLAQDIAQLKQKVNESARVAAESSIAIQGLLENELLHRQMIDAQSGAGQ